MRELKFRGKCVDKGEWVYGHYIENTFSNGKGVNFALLSPTLGVVEVVRGSVGQLTILKDKNGDSIYEGMTVIKTELDDASDEYFEWCNNMGDVDREEYLKLKNAVPFRTISDIVTLDRHKFWLKNEVFGYEGEELQNSEDYEIVKGS